MKSTDEAMRKQALAEMVIEDGSIVLDIYSLQSKKEYYGTKGVLIVQVAERFQVKTTFNLIS